MMQGFLPGKLRLARAEQGLTLRQAAERTGVAKETLSELERGLRTPHPGTLYRVAQGLGIEVRDLMEEPALAGKSEAPRETGQSLLDRALTAARRDEEKNSKAISRLGASEGVPQSISEFDEDKFRAELRSLGFPDEYFESFIWPLVVNAVRQEREIGYLQQELREMEAALTNLRGAAEKEGISFPIEFPKPKRKDAPSKPKHKEKEKMER